MDRLIEDLRHSARVLRRSPGFTVVAVLTIAFAIGANTAIFSLVNAVLLRPLPIPELNRLVVIREDVPDLNLVNAELAPAEVLDLAARKDVFEAVAGFQVRDRTLTEYGEPIRVSTAMTLGDFFAVFRVRPYSGGLYRPGHSTDGPREVAVISYGLWRQLSGGDSSFIGKRIQLNGVPHEVLGIMPPGPGYPRRVQIWVPFQYTDRWKEPQMRGSLIMTAIARLASGISAPQVNAQLQAQARHWTEQYPAGGAGKVLSSTSFVDYLAGPLRPILLVLMGAVIFVLMIAAANIASLQLVRAAGRSREMAVRAAFGAGRARIVRHLLGESVLLALLGGAVGLWLADLGLRVVARQRAAQEMYLSGIELDGTVLAFTALSVLVTAAAFGIIPALRAARVEPQEVLRESPRGASAGLRQHRLLRATLVTQVALALVLLLGSGLMIRTLSRLLATDPGFSAENLTTAQVSIPGATYNTGEKAVAFFDALLDRTRGAPGVEAVALVWGLPFTDQDDSSPFDIPGQPAHPGEPERHARSRIVSSGYFRTMRIPLLQGRDFDGTERPGSPFVAVIDETFANQFFPGGNALGKQIRGYFDEPATIIGVVGRVDHDAIGDTPKAVAYYSHRHQYWSGWRSIVIRSSLPAEQITRTLRSTVSALDPNVPVYDIQTMEGRVQNSLGPRRLALLALGAFAALSLVLSSLGVYGVMRYTTDQRAHEIGIRMALGARPQDVVRMVIRQGMALSGLGLMLGILAAVTLTRFMTGVLFRVSPHDPISFIGATAVLAAVTLGASWISARRATRLDPMEAMRSQ